jgi:hypothetical protein
MTRTHYGVVTSFPLATGKLVGKAIKQRHQIEDSGRRIDRRVNFGFSCSSGATGIPHVDGYELASDGVLLGKPWEETGLATALAQFRKSIP